MTAYEMRMSDWSSDVCSSDLGWIPEAVFTTASVTPGRKTLHFDTPDFGAFSFHPLAIADYRFLIGVDRVQMGKLTAFVAQDRKSTRLNSVTNAHLVCRLLLEKKNIKYTYKHIPNQ